MRKLSFITGSLTLYFIQVCTAQGLGEYGANRRVETPLEYGGVSGTFAEPQFNATYNATQTNNVDTPQMYLGIVGFYEVDAGLSWIPDRNPQGALNVYRRNWHAFTRLDGGGILSLYHNGTLWKKARNNLDSAFVRVYVAPVAAKKSEVRMDIIHNGTAMTATPRAMRDLTGSTNTEIASSGITAAQNMTAKRVIAITQSGGTYLDGSYLTGASFTGGEVAKIFYNPSYQAIETGSTWVNWNTAGGNPDYFFPTGRIGQPVIPGLSIINPADPWVIDSPSTHARHKSGSNVGLNSNRSTVFQDENVTIRLFRRKPVVSKAAKPRK